MASDKLYSLVLASQSPRRQELLSWLQVPFECHPMDIEEDSPHTDPVHVAEDIARQKGIAAYEALKCRQKFGEIFFPMVVASDTLVTLDGKIYGKPTDVNHARQMLKELSGNVHKVVTGVYLGALDKNSGEYRERVFSCQTMVEFRPITEDILENYLESGESLDKAGSYGIQGQGLTFIGRLDGSYSNVVGFPLADFVEVLREFLGLARFDQGEWRKHFHVK